FFCLLVIKLLVELTGGKPEDTLGVVKEAPRKLSPGPDLVRQIPGQGLLFAGYHNALPIKIHRLSERAILPTYAPTSGRAFYFPSSPCSSSPASKSGCRPSPTSTTRTNMRRTRRETAASVPCRPASPSSMSQHAAKFLTSSASFANNGTA